VTELVGEHGPELGHVQGVEERRPDGERRYLEVLKRRGAAPLPGRHPFTITSAGLTVHPQLETTVGVVRVAFDPTHRAPFDLPALDGLLAGGLTRQTMTVVAGSPGTGKTLLGLHFLLAGVTRGEPGLWLGFHETHEQLLARAAQHRLDLATAVEQGNVELLVQPPIDLDPDILAHRLAAAIEARGVRRLVIDSVAELERAVDPNRVNTYLAALVGQLRRERVTVLLTKEIGRAFTTEVDFTDLPILLLADNVLLLRHVQFQNELHRTLAVLKMRFSAHDHHIREFTIHERGMRVLEREESATGVLEGITTEAANDARQAPPTPDETRP